MNLDRKYRPPSLDGVVGHENIIKDLRSYLRTGDPPHMMFVGVPGIGKNTVAYAFATEYFGRPISLDTENRDRDYLELNASKERGIDTVREVIEDFASTDANYETKRIIFLDEVEGTTRQYQMALRSIMEKWEHNCIFILSLNDVSGIVVPALFSRCSVFEFKPPKIIDISFWLADICEQEGIYFEDEDFDDIAFGIIRHYKGDMRRILIDCVEAMKGSLNRENITKDDLYKIFDDSSKQIAEQVYEAPDNLKKFIKIWEKEKFDVRRFLKEYFILNQYQKAKTFALVDARLREGCNEMIQITYLMGEL